MTIGQLGMDLSEEQRLMVETARKVGERFGLTYWRDLDSQKAFPAEYWSAVCEAGLCGVALPEEYGGSGLGMLEMVLIVEQLAATGGGSTVGQLFMLNPIFGGVSIAKFGSESMKRELLPRLISGDLQFCMALTEPEAGSNTLSITTFAKAEADGGWRLRGQKIWISGVAASEKMLVVARTTKAEEAKSRASGLSLFLIDTNRAGVSHQEIEKLGTNTIPSSTVFFDDVRIEPDELLGTLDGGWPELLDVLNTERVVTTAGLVGTCDLAAREAVAYGNTRKVFGNAPIASYQGLQFPLAQSYAEAQAAKLMNRQAAALFDRDLPYGSEANMSKLIAAKATSAITEQAMQIMGGMGYAKESHMERLWRDCRLFRFAPISEEMILNFIAVHQLGMPRGY